MIKLENPKVKLNEESKKIILPDISDEELWERYKRIKPIVKNDNLYYYLKTNSIEMLRNQSFLWNAKEELREHINSDTIEEIDEFSCYHTYGYYGLFKPTIAEILEQFPDELIEDANAFYLSQFPNSIQELNEQKEIINLGCHKTKVKALRLKK